jgi:hypothetical protein
MGQGMRCALIFLFTLAYANAQSTSAATDEVYRVYTEFPRLFLRAQRLRLLKRERERKSMRWEQFETLIKGGAKMDEPGLAYGLYAAVTGDPAWAKKAIDWALAAPGPIRQIAFVYDWCRPSLTPAQSKAIEAKLGRAAQASGPAIANVRDRVLAAIALGDSDAALSERVLRGIAKDWWQSKIAPALERGQTVVPREDNYALFEILHAVRDNLNIDLREYAPKYFKSLPSYYLLSHYPAPLEAPENEFRVPAFHGPGDPDLNAAALSRAAGLAMVAFDNNATESQFLQGYLLQDHFLMRGSFGIPYEFLWANPYQPGLPYFRFPLSHHDPLTGRLFVRSSWEDDALWFGIVGGQLQLFADGKITILNPKLKQQPIDFGPSLVVIASDPMRFEAESEEEDNAFVVGLKPKTRYNIEVDDEEMSDAVTDPAGTLAIPLTKGLKAGVRISEFRSTGRTE